MEKVEGIVEEETGTGKPRIKGFIIKGEVFEEIWGQNKKPIGIVKGDKAYDNNQNYLGKAIYYQGS